MTDKDAALLKEAQATLEQFFGKQEPTEYDRHMDDLRHRLEALEAKKREDTNGQ